MRVILETLCLGEVFMNDFPNDSQPCNCLINASAYIGRLTVERDQTCGMELSGCLRQY